MTLGPRPSTSTTTAAGSTAESRAAGGMSRGGMGTVSFLIHDAAVEAGAVVAAGVPVSRILPGEGVELAGGDRVLGSGRGLQRGSGRHCRLGESADPAWRKRVEAGTDARAAP